MSGDVQTVTQNGITIPIRSIYIAHIPAFMCRPQRYHALRKDQHEIAKNSKTQRQLLLKSDLESIYKGQVNSVITRYHLSNAPRGSNTHKIQFAIVEFRDALTATSALRGRFCWSNGVPIRAVPAKNQPQPSADDPYCKPFYSDMSRLRHLNDDCLLTLCEYLSFWDVLNMSESSAQLGEFVTENIVPKYARNCDLFVCGWDKASNTDMPQISRSSFRRAITLLGPQLTQLSLSGYRLAIADTVVCLQAVIDHCPGLVSLRLFNVDVNGLRRDRRKLLDGSRWPQLKELCLTRCECVDPYWFKFINQLSGLETLVLHDSLREYSYDTPTPTLTCSSLRKLSVLSVGPQCQMMIDTVMLNRETLRELYIYLETASCDEITKLHAAIGEHLPLLECLWVHPQKVETRTLAKLSGLQQLRKIILYKGDGPTTEWMRQLAAGPNRVEHLVLLQTSLLDAVPENVGAFGSQLRVLELRQLNPTHMAELEALLGRFTGLDTLEILDCPEMDDVLLSAIRTCPQLRRVVLRESLMDGNLMSKLVQALRSAANAKPKMGDGLTRRLEIESHDLPSTDCKDLDLLQSNADILTVVYKEPTFRSRSLENLPIDEYMLEVDGQDGDENESLFDYDIDDSDDYDYDDDDDDDDLYGDAGGHGFHDLHGDVMQMNNEHGLELGNELLEGIIRRMH